MNGNFLDRVSRLHEIIKCLPVTKSFPLLVQVRLDANLYSRLAFYIRHYILSSLNAIGADVNFSCIAENILDVYYQSIMSLPNITPNGSIIPKKEIAFEFNMAHRSISRIFESLNIDQYVESIHLPAGIRIVDGKGNKVIDSRPYSSTKLHTDLWSGDPLRSIVVFIPVLGDAGNTSLDFYEPQEADMKELMCILPDYNEGAKMMQNAKKYSCEFVKGFAYIGDSLILHRTVKRGGGLRVSVNFRFFPKSTVVSDTMGDVGPDMNWQRYFVPIAQWHSVGNGVMLVPQETFEEAAKKFKGEAGKTLTTLDFSTHFNIVKLL